MSFKEKTAWVSLTILVGVYGLYFSAFIRDAVAAGGPPDIAAVRGELVPTVIGLIVLLIAAHIAAAVLTAMTGGSTAEDERDAEIALHGERNGGSAVAFGAVMAMGVLLFGQGNPVVVVHVLLAGLVAGEAINQASRIAMYRRGV